MANNKEKKEKSFWDYWSYLEIAIGTIAVAIVVVVAFSQVIARYVIGSSIQWAEEICKFGIIWMTFGGAAYAFATGANIGVTFAVDRLPKTINKILNIIIQLVIIGVFVFLLYWGTERTIYQITSGTVAPASRLSMAIPYSAIPVGSALTIVRLCKQFVDMLKPAKEVKTEGEV